MRSIFSLAILTLIASCGMVRTDGGQAGFDPQAYVALEPDQHALYAQTVVKREERDPDYITLEKLRASEKGSIRRMGVVLFETQYQPSRSGLAIGRNVYLSDKGKQALAEETWSFWDRALRRATGTGVEWVKRTELEQSKAFRAAGAVQADYVMVKRYELGEGDIFWKSGGQEIPMTSLVLPRNQQDVSILFVPATEMMLGPKSVEHQKHWVNEICKELKLDAVLIVSSQASWQQGGKEKRTQEVIPEEMQVAIDASILYPWSTYISVARQLGERNALKKSVPLATYRVKTTIPISISVPEDQQTFETIQQNILTPFRASYQALTALMIERIAADLRAPGGR
jgi:hypothetical protein